MFSKAYLGFLIAAAVIANIAAKISLKSALTTLPKNSEKAALLQLFEQSTFWLGILFAIVLLGAYLAALRDLPVSTVYIAVTSLAMVGLAITDRVLFATPMGGIKLVGITLVIIGVWLIFLRS